MPKDKASIERIKLLHPSIITLVTNSVDKAESSMPKNEAIRIVQGLRTFSEQDSLYALGRTKINPDGKSSAKPMGNIVTNAQGGKSIHNYGLAVDFALLIDKDNNGTFDELSWSMTLDMNNDSKTDWSEVVNCFKSFGFSWGGDWRTFKDNPHCDMTFGHDWRWFLQQYNAKNFIPNTNFVKVN